MGWEDDVPLIDASMSMNTIVTVKRRKNSGKKWKNSWKVMMMVYHIIIERKWVSWA